MPVYTYRREDGTTFEYRQKFLDDPLTIDPATGQRVVRVVQPAGIIFKGSGFYVTDSKSASKKSINGPAHTDTSGAGESTPAATTTPPADKAESKPETKITPTPAT